MPDIIEMQSNTKKIKEIWDGDKLGREQEGRNLIAYIESLSNREWIREDKRSYTIAVDAHYGEGKTFFLKRVADQMRLDHPVAFVDAWADDLANEPLTALAATLKEALKPFLEDDNLRAGFERFMAKTGKVAKIVSKGLLRRGAGFAIGAGAVEGIEAVIANPSDDLKEVLEDAGKGTADDGSDAVRSITTSSLMEKRIEEFNEGQKAVQEMKDSLTAIVASLDKTDSKAPIVIVIDELDRCRPTYAIKLLEEIKHLFDVAGLVFVFAIHGEQLGHSVSGAYGASFDGRAYLRRFIDREYRLKEPNLEPLLSILLGSYNFDRNLSWPTAIAPTHDSKQPPLNELLAEYMRIYDLGARDAFQIVDMLQTSVALAHHNQLHGPYFVPLLIGRLKNEPKGKLPTPVNTSKYLFMPNYDRFDHSNQDTINFCDLAEKIQAELSHPWSYYEDLFSASGKLSYVQGIGRSDEQVCRRKTLDWSPSGYPNLLDNVGNFEGPQK